MMATTFRQVLNLKKTTLCLFKNIQYGALGICARNYCSGGQSVEDLYIDRDMQDLLKNIVKADRDKVFQWKYEKRLEIKDALISTQYQVLSQEQMDKKEKNIEMRAQNYMVLPPYMVEKPEDITVISANPELEGYFKYNHVFLDISKKARKTERLIVTRETSGLLRTATREERDRMIQIFYPAEGKTVNIPKLFHSEILKKMLDNGQHLNLLQRVCNQFEPDTSEFIKFSHKIYDAVDTAEAFENLEGSRFFPTMVFHLAVNKRLDRLLVYLLRRENMEGASNAVRVYHKIHPDCASAKRRGKADDTFKQQMHLIQNFAKKDAHQGGMIEIALQHCIDLQRASILGASSAQQ